MDGVGYFFRGVTPAYDRGVAVECMAAEVLERLIVLILASICLGVCVTHSAVVVSNMQGAPFTPCAFLIFRDDDVVCRQ